MVIVLFTVKVIMPYRTKVSVRFIANIIIAKIVVLFRTRVNKDDCTL
jgi:hypothetical protein